MRTGRQSAQHAIQILLVDEDLLVVVGDGVVVVEGGAVAVPGYHVVGDGRLSEGRS